jgi:hypothetical protein
MLGGSETTLTALKQQSSCKGGILQVLIKEYLKRNGPSKLTMFKIASETEIDFCTSKSSYNDVHTRKNVSET